MKLRASTIHLAVAHAIAASEMQVISIKPQYGMILGSNVSQSNDALSAHIRNGGEPWKTKNKRGRR